MGSDFKKLLSNIKSSDDPKASQDDPDTGTKTVSRKTRPTGKRSDPKYTQVSAYIPKDLYRRVKVELVSRDQNFSELVSQLLQEWLEGYK